MTDHHVRARPARLSRVVGPGGVIVHRWPGEFRTVCGIRVGWASFQHWPERYGLDPRWHRTHRLGVGQRTCRRCG